MAEYPVEQRITVEGAAWVAALDQALAAMCELAFVMEIEDALAGS
jgi:hypothetical protein